MKEQSRGSSECRDISVKISWGIIFKKSAFMTHKRTVPQAMNNNSFRFSEADFRKMMR